MGVGGKNKAALRIGFPTEKEANDYVDKGSWQISIQEQFKGTAFEGMNIDEKALSERGIAITSKEDLKAAIDRNLSREKTETERQKLADRIWDRMQKKDSGTSLPRKEGMEAFYGVPTEGTLGIVGKVAESLFKQTPKTVEIDKGEDYKTFTKYQIVRYENHPKEWAVIKNGNILERFKTHDEAQAFKTDAIIKERAEGNKSTQHSIDITPELKAEVSGGVPLFGDIKSRGKEIADFIRTLRPPANSAQSNILGLPLAIYDTLIVTVANLVEGGATIAQAVVDAIRQLKADGRIKDADLKDFDEKEFTAHIKERKKVGEYVAGVLSEFPDATTEEIMDAIQEDAPKFIDTPEKKAAIEAMVRGMVEPKVEAKVAAENEFKGEPSQYGENAFLYVGTKKERVSGLMRHIQAAKGISKEAKQRFEDKLNYKVANNEEARNIANALIKELGDIDALTVARGTDMHPSVRSAIYAGLIDNAFAQEAAAKKANDEDAAMDAARQWAELSTEYDDKLTEGGQFTSYAQHFYRQSPMGFILKAEKQRQERIDEFMKGKEAQFQEVFDFLKGTQEGSAIIEGEVEKLRKEERKERRKSRDKQIDAFFDKAIDDIMSGTYSTIPFTPQALKLVMNAARISVKAGDRIADVVKIAIEKLNKEANGATWDKDRVAAYLQKGLEREADADEIQDKKTLEQSLIDRKKELERRIREKDFSDEAYKGKKDLSASEQQAKNELAEVEKAYNEAKKKSTEWIDKKSKQYLEQLSKKLKGLDESKKMEVINKSLKKIIASGGLKMEEFRDIVAEAVGIKKLTDADVAKAEGYMADINAVDEIENEYVANPTKQNREKYQQAQQKSLQSTLDLHNMMFANSDIVRTIKSLITGGLLGVPTLVKNIGQNIILQSTFRFPVALIRQMIDLGFYGVTSALSKINSNIVPVVPNSNILDAQKGYFAKGKLGIARGAFNFRKGTIDADIFGKKEYQSTLAPKIAARELSQWKKGELYLTKVEVLDRLIRKSFFARQSDFILRGMAFGDNPQRWAAEGATAIQIAKSELNLTKDEEIEAFILSPKKYATKVFLKKGASEKQALESAQEIEDRIVSAGEASVLQSPTLLSMASEYVEKGLRKSDSDNIATKAAKGVGSVLKTLTFPFVKIPSNVYWTMFKIANPQVSFLYAVSQLVVAKNYDNRGDAANATRYREMAKNNLSTAVLGMGLSLVASSLVAAGLVRGGNDDDDEPRETIGERTFGKQFQVNMGKLMGGGDYWVDLSWLGPLGSLIDIKSRMREDEKDRERKGEAPNSDIENMIDELGY
jgi:hypothetical protein